MHGWYNEIQELQYGSSMYRTEERGKVVICTLVTRTRNKPQHGYDHLTLYLGKVTTFAWEHKKGTRNRLGPERVWPVDFGTIPGNGDQIITKD